MFIAITVIHIIACLFLIGVVLLQQGKGADMGAVFGGSSQTIFGSSGAGNFLTRLTAAAAVTFMLTSLTLAYSGARNVTSTVFDDAPLPAAAPADVDAGAPMPEAGGVAPDEAARAAESSEAAAPAAAKEEVADEAVQAAPAAAAENEVAGEPPGAEAQPAAPQ